MKWITVLAFYTTSTESRTMHRLQTQFHCVFMLPDLAHSPNLPSGCLAILFKGMLIVVTIINNKLFGLVEADRKRLEENTKL